MKYALKWWVAIAASLVASAALADISDLNADVDGKGKLRISGNDYSITGARIRMLRDGKFELTVRSGRESWSFKGNWNAGSRTQASLSTTSSPTGQRAMGFVTVRDREDLDKISLKAISGNRLELEFESTEQWGGSGGNWRPPTGGNWNGEFGDAIRGSGSYRRGGESITLREVRVRLARGGKADVWLVTLGGRNIQLDGKWFEKRGDKVDLHIDSAGREGQVDARGQLTIDRSNQLFRVDIDGRIGRDNLEIKFERKDSDKPDSGNDNWNNFDESASGEGYFDKNGSRHDLDKVSLRLMSNGRFDMTLRGKNAHRYTGTYVRKGNTAHLIINGGGTGTGSIEIRNRKIGQVAVDVLDGRDRLRYRFDGN